MRILLLFAVAAFSALNVPLTVKDGANAGAVSQYPVKVGVPLPLGAYDDMAAFRVTDASGNTVPAQFDVLGRYWPRSSSIRVVLVQFAADVAGNGKSRYYLKDDGTGNSWNGITCAEDAGRYYVNAGKLRFEVKKSGFNILDRLWYDADNSGVFEAGEEMLQSGDGNGAALWDTLGAVSRDTAKAGLEFTLEESGPFRWVLKAESPTDASANGWGFIVRIHAYYNQPFVTLDYYLKNSAYGRTGHHLYYSRFSLVNAIKGLGGATVRLGGNLDTNNAGAYEGALGASETGTQSTAWFNYTVNGLQKSGRGAGYADISDGSKGVMAVVRKFAHLWPTGLSVTTDKKLCVDLWPEGSHRMVDGSRRSHQVMLYFHAGSATQADLYKQAKLFQQYPVPVLQPKWYAQTHAMFDYGGIGFPSDTAWGDSQWVGTYGLKPTDPTAGSRGDHVIPISANDSNFTGWWNWGGNTDRRNSCLGGGAPTYLDMFVNFGSPEFFYHSDDMARHTAEMRPMWMDNYVIPRDQGMLTVEYPPAVGLRTPHAALDNRTWTSWDILHTWNYEVGQYYFMAGERFCADYLKMHSDFLRDRWINSGYLSTAMKWPFHDFSREHGEPMHTIVDAYKISGDQKYWDAAMGFVGFVLDNYKSPYGLWSHSAGTQGNFPNALVDIYFMIPEITPAERVMKERILLALEGAANGQIFWGGNNYLDGNSVPVLNTWGQAYAYRADSVYQRPASGNWIYSAYSQNSMGLCYFLMGDSAYRQILGYMNNWNVHEIWPTPPLPYEPINFMDWIPFWMSEWAGPYFRISSAAWYCPDQKQAVCPPAITDLSAMAAANGRVTLEWTSVGGDAYRIHWSDKPIVEKFGRIAPLDSGPVVFPYPDTAARFTNIYRAMPIDAPFTPKAAGNRESFTTPALPESLAGRKVFFNLQAVDIVSEVDQSRSPISNTDSIVLDASSGQTGPDSSSAARVEAVYVMGSGEILVTLYRPLVLDAGDSLGVGLSRIDTRSNLPVSSVEVDTRTYRLLRIRTSGLLEGRKYSLFISGMEEAVYFPADFRPNLFSVRKISFGLANYSRNGYEPAHAWDGDYGYNTPSWNAYITYGTCANPDSGKQGNYSLNGFTFGDCWFKMKVSPLVEDYAFSAFVCPSGNVTRLRVEDTLVWNQTNPETQDMPLIIRDGMLDVTFEHISALYLSPVLDHFMAVAIKDIQVERPGLTECREAFLMNCPNPFNPSTRITFSPGRMDSRTRVRLVVYDLRGRLVQELTPDDIQSRQVRTVVWDGGKMASGLYCVRLTSGAKTFNRKLILLK